jgi:hypothetical protein
MKRELQEKLYEEYPKIFEQKDLSMAKTAMCWGISCGDGWYDILDVLCREIQILIDYPVEEIARCKKQLAENEDLPEYTRDYLKERISELEKNIIDQVQATQVKEKFGQLRFYVNGGNDRISASISFAESMSLKVCEICGNSGKPTGDYWVKTLCSSCSSKED